MRSQLRKAQLFESLAIEGRRTFLEIVLVVLMLVHYSIAGRWLKGVEKGKPLPSSRALRWFNEVPVLLLVGIVFLVLAKPF